MCDVPSCALCGEGIDTAFHRVWECSSPEISEARSKVAGAKQVPSGERAGSGLLSVHGGQSMLSWEEQSLERWVPDGDSPMLCRRVVHGPDLSVLCSSGMVRGAARRQRESRQGRLRQRACAPHSVRCGGGTRGFFFSPLKMVFARSCAGNTACSGRRSPTGRRRACGGRLGAAYRHGREFGVETVSVQKITSHKTLDDGVDGSSARDVLGNERADEFARKEAKLHASDKFDVATVAVHRKLVVRVAKTAATVLALYPAPSEVLGLLGATRKGGFHGPRRPRRGVEPLRHTFELHEDRWRCFRCLVARPAGRCGGRHGRAS